MSCLIMTLEEMLKLALGTTPLEQVQVAILHNFLKILIEKLKIQSDFVEILGPEAKVLREMLCEAHNPLVEFTSCSDENICCGGGGVNISKMEDDINKLSTNVNKIESEFRKHLDSIENCKRPPADCCLQLRKPIDKQMFEEESFSSDGEDLCVPCDEKNLIACDLLQNEVYLKKLMRRVTSPVVDRIFEFEDTIRMLNEKFQNFLNTAEDEYRKIPLIENCFAEIRAVKDQLDNQQDEFVETMEEVQDMMDTKLDKMHMPALKKYIYNRMSEIEAKLDAVIQKEQCPKAAGVIMTNLQCLSCTTKVCQKDKAFPVPLLPAFKRPEMKQTMKETRNDPPNDCIPQVLPRACGGDHTVIRPDEKNLHKYNLIDDFGDQMNLSVDQPTKMKFFKGLRGRMYRLDPKLDVSK